MKQIVTTLYTFDELPQEAKQKALNENYFINTEYPNEWYQYYIDELYDIGFEVVELELWQNKLAIHPKIELRDIAFRIMKYFEPNGRLYTIAKMKIENENDENFDDFIDRISDEYLRLINEEMEHLESEEAIIETFRANDYHFDLSGKIRG